MNRPTSPSIDPRDQYGARFVDGTPDKVMYLTDDRDLRPDDLRSLVILLGGNGDWYVQVAGANGRTSEGVRICTSGGASTHCPGLGPAIAAAYRAMRANAEGFPAPQSTVDMEEEVRAWRDRFPKLVFDRFEIVRKDEEQAPEAIDPQKDLITRLRRMAVPARSTPNLLAAKDLANDIVEAIDAVVNVPQLSSRAFE